MNILPLIEIKKRGGELDADQITGLVDGFTGEAFPEYQMASWLMSVWFAGMTDRETADLTGAMLHSGRELDWSHLERPTADKHSTGGVGDKVSLLLAPLAAACGLAVPMLSGRGLGHTGGTLDKLEAIPGYDIHLDNDAFARVVADVGCAVVGQGPEIAPADGRIYALRDVTGTVDSVPLITASIMSKKLAAGPRAIVIDLKTGDGAFMTDPERARELARRLKMVGEAHGRSVTVVFSDMTQPLGVAVGHANETVEAFQAMRPDGHETAPQELVNLTGELTAWMVVGAGLEKDAAAARVRVREAWTSGAAFECLLAWVAAQGGRLDPDREDFGLDVAPRLVAVTAPRAGHVTALACRTFGLALGEIGGARRTVTDRLDPSSGVDVMVRTGDVVEEGQPLAWVRAHDADAAGRCAALLDGAVTIGDEPLEATPLVFDILE